MPRRRLGEILRERHHLSNGVLRAALGMRARTAVPVGTVLTREGAISTAELTDALAEQSGLVAINLERHAPVAALSVQLDPTMLLKLGALPWRRVAGRVVCVLFDPRSIQDIRTALEPIFGEISFALAQRAQIEAQIARIHRATLVERARNRCPESLSCRRWAEGAWRCRPWAVLFCALALLGSFPALIILGLLAWITVFNALTTAMRAVALVDSFRPSVAPITAPPGVVRLSPKVGQPVVSLLIPLYHEDLTLRHLIDSLARSTYPKALMDVVFILEEDDIATPLALAQIGLPPWARVLTVPDDTLKTKPRAMNYALDFCQGSVIGIYDAEDRPEPDQLSKVVDHLSHAAPEVGCVQGYLDFYNSRQNWLARCFTIEYAIWFRVLLRGVQRLGVPIPLGGTTVFFRRTALEAVGAWDAHNVTEDADLGMRLARFGYRTEMVATTTMEEANCDPRAWIPQRARWLKGYAMTWGAHMRRPLALWRDLGHAGFLGFQVLLLGGLTAYLASPLFWVLWLSWWGLDMTVFDAAPPAFWGIFFGSMVIGQTVMILVALRATCARARRHLVPWVVVLPFYWPLGALAAYRAVTDLFTRPFHWAKTTHGL